MGVLLAPPSRQWIPMSMDSDGHTRGGGSEAVIGWSGVDTVQVLKSLASVEGNDVCADCGANKDVDWVWVFRRHNICT